MFRLAGSSPEGRWWRPLQVSRLLRRPDDNSVRRLRDLGRPVHPGGATVRPTELLRNAGSIEGRRKYTGEWEAIQKGASRGSVIEVSRYTAVWATSFFWVRKTLGMTFNYLILWVRVNGQG